MVLEGKCQKASQVLSIFQFLSFQCECHGSSIEEIYKTLMLQYNLCLIHFSLDLEKNFPFHHLVNIISSHNSLQLNEYFLSNLVEMHEQMELFKRHCIFKYFNVSPSEEHGYCLNKCATIYP